MSLLRNSGLFLAVALSSTGVRAQGSLDSLFVVSEPLVNNKPTLGISRPAVTNTTKPRQPAQLSAWQNGPTIKFIYQAAETATAFVCTYERLTLYWEGKQISNLMLSPNTRKDTRCTYSGTVRASGNRSLLAGYYSLSIANRSASVSLSACPDCTQGKSIEYVQSKTGHYYQTADLAEQNALDNGYNYGVLGRGWQRTGESFKVWMPTAGQQNNVLPVSQFLNPTPATFFLTNNQADIDLLTSLPPGGWSLDKVVFSLLPPINAENCPAGGQPVYRLYNQRFVQNDSNHRYVTNKKLADEMVKQSWQFEGVQLCAPR